MSAALAAPAATTPADPQPDRPAASAASGTGRLLSLLYKLIDYAKDFAATLHQHAAASDFFLVARRFGTADLALILARITNGLRLAGMLQARLLQRKDHDTNARPAPARNPPPRQRHAAPPAASCADDDLRARLPTAEQIAAELRRRPVGAVLADIARDIGIMPNHPLWRELRLMVSLHGGSFIRLWRDVTMPASYLAELRLRQRPVGHAAAPEPYPQFLAPAGTGPP